ncbi:hypothetical protein WQQ_22450 [Hydrocarboniphaga effusa AP103]|uniref:Uncharacterized protein n=1 Tax=Hydrocarboniphaga effusa AP103 TaxID=1172194 RepID=I8TEI7_9GAMM|nr:hypothetical protein WQQ_22450 [Hydrocarboniphaga effusa AP103]
MEGVEPFLGFNGVLVHLVHHRPTPHRCARIGEARCRAFIFAI